MRCASRSASPVRWPVAVHEFRAGRRRCASSAVLFETLTGEVPHAGPTAQAVIAKVTTIEKRSVTAVRPPNPRILRHLWAARSIALPAAASPDVDAFIAALDTPHVGDGSRATCSAPVVHERSLHCCACRRRVRSGGLRVHRRLVRGGIEKARETQGTSSTAGRVSLRNVTQTHHRLGMPPGSRPVFNGQIHDARSHLVRSGRAVHRRLLR